MEPAPAVSYAPAASAVSYAPPAPAVSYVQPAPAVSYAPPAAAAYAAAPAATMISAAPAVSYAPMGVTMMGPPAATGGLFALIDRNHDGSITRSELAAAF